MLDFLIVPVRFDWRLPDVREMCCIIIETRIGWELIRVRLLRTRDWQRTRMPPSSAKVLTDSVLSSTWKGKKKTEMITKCYET